MAVVEGRWRVMASDVLVVADGGPPGLLDSAAALLHRLEQTWSRFLPDSDVSRLNRAAGLPVRVDPSTVTLVDTMIDGWRATAGGFDPTLLRPLLAVGYDVSHDDPRMRTSLRDDPCHSVGGRRPSLDDVEIDRDRFRVTLPGGLAVDPGGIGKGLAADLAVASMLGAGASAALVSIGGDLRADGHLAGGWTVEVERPRTIDPAAEGAVHCVLSLDAGGVATSSTRSRRWLRSGHEVHHVIDPVDEQPSRTDLDAVTVVARSGWLAEAHATAALLAGTGGVLDHLRHHRLSGLAFATDGRVLASPDLQEVAAA